MAYLTLSIEGDLDAARRAAIEQSLRREGGTAVWRVSPTAGRSYALLELPNRADATAICAVSAGTVYEKAIIALAVFPAVAEALPPLRNALGGPGRPEGVLACLPCPGGLIVEWDPDITHVEIVMALIDVELKRWRSGRTAELLSPLPRPLVAMVAANGLQAPQIVPERILERSKERA